MVNLRQGCSSPERLMNLGGGRGGGVKAADFKLLYNLSLRGHWIIDFVCLF